MKGNCCWVSKLNFDAVKIQFRYRYASLLLILLTAACVDRITFDAIESATYGMVVDGFISDQPGPYTVNVSSSFDPESTRNLKNAVSRLTLELSDNVGNKETLTEVSPGNYQTAADGIRGIPGRVYTLTVKTHDGRTYVSRPDTLPVPASIDRLYFEYTLKRDTDGKDQAGYDFYTDNTSGTTGSRWWKWRFTGTFQAETRPELVEVGGAGTASKTQCYPLDGKCNYLPPCSGWRNTGTTRNFSFAKLFPCTCCTCWYNLYNDAPVLNDALYTSTRSLPGVFVHRVPVDYWIFMHRLRAEVFLFTMSRESFRFFQAIKDQRDAVNSLFQPVSGRMPVNFTQTEGRVEEVQGLFYAAGVSSKALFIERDEVPGGKDLPDLDSLIGMGIGKRSCLEIFPNATSVRPSFWKD